MREKDIHEDLRGFITSLFERIDNLNAGTKKISIQFENEKYNINYIFPPNEDSIARTFGILGVVRTLECFHPDLLMSLVKFYDDNEKACLSVTGYNLHRGAGVCLCLKQEGDMFLEPAISKDLLEEMNSQDFYPVDYTLEEVEDVY